MCSTFQVVHEKALDRYHLARSQRRALLLDWAQARKAFLLKAVASAAEASAAHQAEAALAGTRLKQQEICADLKAKVRSVIHLPHPNPLGVTVKFKMKLQCLSEEKLTEASCRNPVFTGLMVVLGS